MNQLRGVDISHHNNIFDFKKLFAGGWPYAFLKATEGTTFIDPRFNERWAAVKAAGVIRGAYHFFHANKDPIAQAHHYLQVIGKLGVGDLPAALDFEVTDGIGRETQIAQIQTWLDIVEKETGKVPIFYSYVSFIKALSLPQSFTRYPLWLANYKVSAPHVPGPWKACTFWQDAEDGASPGAGRHVDTDYFYGNMTDLKKLAGLI